jgi:hypothetical protein
MSTSDKLTVFISSRESVCDECKENLGSGAWIYLNEKKEALCLSCADLDHLEFLPSGNMALTLRSKKYSSISAIVLKWSKSRKRYERQGLLVQGDAILKAETECLGDGEQRERRRLREAEKREVLDQNFIQSFAIKIRELYPSCPPDQEKIIAEHACQKYSGRVGRTSAAKSLSENTIHLAVRAHVRHAFTKYDELLSKGVDRSDARDAIQIEVSKIIDRWT